MSDEFSGKVVIVTGSSSGIGEDAIIAFARLGAQTVVTGRNAMRVAVVAHRCAQVSPKKLVPLEVVADIDKDDEARRLIDETIEAFGHLDILVNNAGVFALAQITAGDVLESMDRLYRINVRALVHLTHLAAPHLIKSKGNIVNVSSVASTTPPGFGSTAYSCSKACVDMITQTCAIELSPRGVRVNAINPAQIMTPILTATGQSQDVQDEVMAMVQRIYPVGRVGRVEDTTRAILFLASEQSSFVSGVKLAVDGGYLSITPRIAYQMGKADGGVQ